MQKNNTIIAAVVVVIVIIAAVGVYYGMNNGGGDNTQNDEGDTYYVYLDNMGDSNGWHVGDGNTTLEGVKAALDSGNVEYDISDTGWINSIAGIQPAADYSDGFGVYVYTSKSVANPYVGYFADSTTLNDVNGNIIYIVFGDYGTDYLVPMNQNAEGLTSEGPFADENYQPLDYNGTFSFYLDFDGYQQWYSGNGSDVRAAFADAMNSAGIQYDISDTGWINSIAGIQPAADYSTGFGIYTYTSSSVENPYAGYFGSSTVLYEVTGNIIYLSFGAYDDSYLVPMDENAPGLMSTGPFA